MKREKLLTEVKEKLVDFGISSDTVITDDMKFIDDFGFDSLDIIEFVLWFELTYKVSVSDEELDKIQTVGEYLNLGLKLINEKK